MTTTTISEADEMLAAGRPANAVLMQGFQELVADLKQIATQDIEPKSSPLEADDLPMLVLQHRVARQLVAVDRFLRRHVERVDRQPLLILMQATLNLTNTKASRLFQPVRTMAMPTGNASDLELWQLLRHVVCAAIRAHMDSGKKRETAAAIVTRALDKHGIRDPQGDPLPNIARWDEGPDKESRERFIAGLKADPPDDCEWAKPDALVDALLTIWREEAEAQGVRFIKAKPKAVVWR
jgi:hypothetical protein